jgi:hypothetical protein
LIVAADSPDEPSAMRTTFSAPGRGCRCAVTTLGVTSVGSLATTMKNTLRSWA